MKTTVKILSALALISLSINVRAVDEAGKTYVKADVGASFQQEITSQTTGAKISFDPGVRGDFTFGYHITDPLAVELEGGVIQNSVDRSGAVKFGGGISSDWYQVPVLANVVYHLPLESSFKPFIGVGAGGVASFVDLNVGPASADDDDFVFGFQGMAGVKYVINENMDVGFSYKFLGTTEHDFNSFVGLNDSTYNHSLLASFSFKF